MDCMHPDFLLKGEKKESLQTEGLLWNEENNSFLIASTVSICLSPAEQDNRGEEERERMT